MKAYVLDTSALIRYYVPDGPIPKDLDDIIEQAWHGDVLLMVPDLALVEAAQVLLKKQQANYLTSDEASEILEHIMNLPLETRPHRDLIELAFGLAWKLNLTVYDAMFLALARKHGAALITADQELNKADADWPARRKIC
jgi:predicted nucleic acid-binding protein